MKKSNIFWIGYSDLLTSLFFVMLVLFVVTIGFLKYQIKTTERELEKIKELQAAVQELPEEYFEYQPRYKRFKLKKHVQFDKSKSIIKPEYYNYLTNVGKEIKALIDDLKKNEELSKLDIKYLVVIEGMASSDNYALNYELSYERALSLFRFWQDRDINFDQTICEIQISGSGTGGIREYSGQEEYLNQQFLIHIIPKMGAIEMWGDREVQQEGIEKELTIIEEVINELPHQSEWQVNYDSVGKFNEDNIALVRNNLMFGFVNQAGQEVIPVEYSYIGPSGQTGLYVVEKDEKIGVVNKSGVEITPIKYEGIGRWSEGFVMVISNGKCGYIDVTGNEVIPLEYDSCGEFESGQAKVLYLGREFYINTDGNYVGKAQ